MNLKYDPDGGDLGRGIKVTVLELVIIIPHIANILQELHNTEISIGNPMGYNKYKYAFEVYSADKQYLELVLNNIKLPTNIYWYECDGMKIFNMRGPSGGVITSLACYLVTK